MHHGAYLCNLGLHSHSTHNQARVMIVMSMRTLQFFIDQCKNTLYCDMQYNLNIESCHSYNCMFSSSGNQEMYIFSSLVLV